MRDNGDHPELVHAISRSLFHRNRAADEFHPAESTQRYALPEEAGTALRLFYEQIATIDDSDYGDFMRKANLYLCDLRESLRERPALAEKLDDMQLYTQFVSNWDVESTRTRLLKDAAELFVLAQG